MKKKTMAFTAIAVLTISMATSAFAASSIATAQRTPAAPVYGLCGGAYGIMWDQDGKFLDSEEFEANLDKLIEDGYIRAEDRDYFIERYDWCTTYGGGSVGTRRGGRGMACGMGRGW